MNNVPEYLKSKITGKVYKMNMDEYPKSGLRGYGNGVSIEHRLLDLRTLRPITEAEYIAAISTVK